MLVGNVGFVFTNGDLKDTREKILSNKVAAPARAGAVAPLDVSFAVPGAVHYIVCLVCPRSIF